VAVILDTNAVSALLAGDPALGEILEPKPVHHLPVIVIGEYRYGVARSKHRRRLERLLELLVRESIVLLVDEETTRHYATVRENLRRAGSPIPENDVWIAALARQHGEPIVSRDQHFDLVDASLRVGW
jgi:predicted nucleic acid-binding protein